MRYFYTQTLKPSMHRFNNTDQYDKTYNQFLDVIRPWKSFAKAELTKINNIHYHAIVEIPDTHEERDRFYNRLRQYYKTLGKFDLEPVQYEVSNEWYLTGKKVDDDRIFKNIVKRPVILIDELNVIRRYWLLKQEDVVESRGQSDRHKEDSVAEKSSLGKESLDSAEDFYEYMKSLKLENNILRKKLNLFQS